MTTLTENQKSQVEKLAIKYKKAQAIQKLLKSKIENILDKKGLDEIVTNRAKIKRTTYKSKSFNKDAFIKEFGLDTYSDFQVETEATRLNITVVETDD